MLLVAGRRSLTETGTPAFIWNAGVSVSVWNAGVFVIKSAVFLIVKNLPAPADERIADFSGGFATALR